MSNLNLQTVELTTSISTAPLNGPTSSEDYNEYQRSVLVDLASLSDFVNTNLIPLVNQLRSDALTTGLTGAIMYSDLSDNSDTFYDAVAQQPLVLGDSLRLLRALIRQLQTKMTNIAVEIATLESKTASSSQADLSSAVASLVNQLAVLTTTVSSLALELNGLSSSVASFGGTIVATPAIEAQAIVQVEVDLPAPYIDNNYIATVSLEDASGDLQLFGFTYQPNGNGVLVLVKNNNATTSTAGRIHLLTKRF